MRKLLYTKYNSFRKKEFQIKTTIYSEDGNKFVVKDPMTPEASSQIDAIKSNYEAFKDAYESIELLPYEVYEAGLKFEYLDGHSLLDGIDFDAGDLDGVTENINKALDIVLGVRDEYIRDFQMSDDFAKVFPGCDPGVVRAFSISNIDSNIDNYIVSGGKTYLIDYEWIARFDIPVDFIKYRTLIYLLDSRRGYFEKRMTNQEFIEKFGISKEAQDLYSQMEKCFQLYVNKNDGDVIFPDAYRKESLPLYYILDEVEENKRLKKDRELTEQHIENLNKIIDEKDKQIAELSKAARNPLYNVRRVVRNRKKS